MDKLKYFIYFVILVRIISIIIGITVEYHHIIDNKLVAENSKQGIDHKKKMENNLKIKKFLDFLFTVLFAIFIFIVFKTGVKEVKLDYIKLFLLKFAAITLIANADWESLFVFIYQYLQKIEHHLPI
jgi:hypothetical protein